VKFPASLKYFDLIRFDLIPHRRVHSAVGPRSSRSSSLSVIITDRPSYITVECRQPDFPVPLPVPGTNTTPRHVCAAPVVFCILSKAHLFSRVVPSCLLIIRHCGRFFLTHSFRVGYFHFCFVCCLISHHLLFIHTTKVYEKVNGELMNRSIVPVTTNNTMTITAASTDGVIQCVIPKVYYTTWGPKYTISYSGTAPLGGIVCRRRHHHHHRRFICSYDT